VAKRKSLYLEVRFETEERFSTISAIPGNMCLDFSYASLIPLVCTENLNPHVVAIKSAKYGVGFDASGQLNRARDRRILIQ
jgi:hypothetical protein